MLSVKPGPYYKQVMEELHANADGDMGFQRRDSGTARKTECKVITMNALKIFWKDSAIFQKLP